MKLFLLMITTFVLSFVLRAQTPYSLSFPGIDGQVINMADFADKKILVTITSAAAPDTLHLRMMDSFYQANQSLLTVIAIPAQDIGTSLGDAALFYALQSTLLLHYVVGQPGMAAKTAGDQHILLKWLTHVSENAHFDEDITEDGQMYMIDEKGNLFGLFDKTTPPSFLEAALAQNSTH